MLKESDIICLAETWLVNGRKILCNQKKHFQVIQANAVKKQGRGRPSGGMLIAFNPEIYKELDKKTSNNCLMVRLEIEKTEIIICCCYIRESDDIPSFFSNYDNLLNEITKGNDDIPILLCGDFNSRIANLNSFNEGLILPNGSSARDSKDKVENKRGRTLCEELEARSFLVLNGRIQGDIPANFTFVDKQGCSTIDLFCTSLTDITLVESLQTMDVISLSDHFPVSLSLNISAKDDCKFSRKRTLRWKPENRDAYVKELEDSKIPKVSDQSVDELNEALQGNIKNAAERAKMYRKPRDAGERGKIWYDEECWKLKCEVRKLWRTWKKSNNDDKLRSEFLNCKDKYKKLLKIKKIQSGIIRINLIKNAKTGRAFWNSLFYRKGKKVTANNISLAKWQDFLNNSFVDKKESSKKLIEVEVECLDSEISIDEIKQSIAKTKNNKAAGIDEISYEFLKALPGNYLEFLKDFFNKIYNEQQTPENWSKILTTMIYKKGDAECVLSYRPIALVNCLGKVFTSVLKSRLEKWMIEQGVLSEEQAGFRRRRGCRDNIFILDFLIKETIRKTGGKLFAFFIDFVTAFPSLNHEKMWEKMEKAGISDKFINTCKCFYNFASSAIKTEKGVTDFVKVSKGVLQGETLSADLFLIFINDIIPYLIMFDLKGCKINSNLELLGLGYADDYVFFALDYNEMKRKIAVLESYCDLNLLELNTAKSKIMIFHKGGIKYKKYRFFYKNKELEIVKTFAYLGVEFSPSGKYNLHFDKTKSTANLATSATVRILKANGIADWDSVELLYNSMVYNAITYCSEIWALDFLENYNKIPSSFYRSLL